MELKEIDVLNYKLQRLGGRWEEEVVVVPPMMVAEVVPPRLGEEGVETQMFQEQQ